MGSAEVARKGCQFGCGAMLLGVLVLALLVGFVLLYDQQVKTNGPLAPALAGLGPTPTPVGSMSLRDWTPAPDCRWCTPAPKP